MKGTFFTNSRQFRKWGGPLRCMRRVTRSLNNAVCWAVLDKIISARANKFLDDAAWPCLVVPDRQPKRWQAVWNWSLYDLRSAVRGRYPRAHIQDGITLTRAYKAADYFGRIGIGDGLRCPPFWPEQTVIIGRSNRAVQHDQRFVCNLCNRNGWKVRKRVISGENAIGRGVDQGVERYSGAQIFGDKKMTSQVPFKKPSCS
jgi:hypothetical protein